MHPREQKPCTPEERRVLEAMADVEDVELQIVIGDHSQSGTFESVRRACVRELSRRAAGKGGGVSANVGAPSAFGDLRGKARVTQEDMAIRLGIPVIDLRWQERTPLSCWSIGDVRTYLSALGYRLELVAIDAQDQREVFK